jgi:hypothetical protein
MQNFSFANLGIPKCLIFKALFFASSLGILLKPAWDIAFPGVKPMLSTKLSTVFVDSPKSAYETRI